MKAIKIPCEHDLLSGDPDIWATAVMRCKSHNPYCGSDGYCHLGGSCFANQELTREQAILEVDRLAQELYEQKQRNDNLSSSSETLISQLELTVEQNKKAGKSERVFAIRYCINEIKRSLNK